MAQTTSTSIADMLFSEVLGQEALASASPRPVVTQFFNQYSLEGQRSKVLALNTYADPGPATAGVEGTTFSTVTTLGLDSRVNITPVESAVMLAQVTDDAIENLTGFSHAAQLMLEGSLDQKLQVFRSQAARLAKAAVEKAETDAVALFANASQSVGTTQQNLSQADIADAIYTLEISEAPNRGFVACLAPRQIHDLRNELMVTSGGVQGVYHAGKSADHVDNLNGFKMNVLGIDVFQYDESAKLSSGDGYDCIGAVFVPGSGAPELDGSGQAGAYAMVEARAMDFRLDHDLRERATDIMVNWKYAVAERKDAWTVKVLSDID